MSAPLIHTVELYTRLCPKTHGFGHAIMRCKYLWDFYGYGIPEKIVERTPLPISQLHPYGNFGGLWFNPQSGYSIREAFPKP